MADLDIFHTILRAFHDHPGKEYAFNQIAYFALRKGNPKNAGIVGRTIFQYQEYFRKSGFGKGVKWSPNWERIARDHSEFYQKLTGKPPVKAESRNQSYKEMMAALDDEKRAVKEELRKYPINIVDIKRAHELEDPGDIIYYLIYFTDLEDCYFPIPDGAPISILLNNRPPINGTLLSNDGLKSTAVVLLEDVVFRETSKAILEPRLEELVSAVRSSVEQACNDTNGKHNLLLNQNPASSKVSSISISSSDHLDDCQKEAASIACSHDITLLWGPPGTGKTYTLGETIAHWVKEGHRVLGLSIANVAVDQICLKTKEALQRHGMVSLLDQGRILRLGHAKDIDVVRERRFFPDKEKAQVIRKDLERWMSYLKNGKNLGSNERAKINLNIKKLRDELKEITQQYVKNAKAVFTTMMQTCMTRSIFLESGFDVVVVDEASMISMPHLIATTSLSKNQILIAGDFRQLGPIAISQSEKSHRWLRKDIFETMNMASYKEHKPITFPMLKTQRRMHPDISKCVNEVFYGGKLQDDPPDSVKRTSLLQPFPGKGATLVEVFPSHECCVEQTQSSRINKGTADISARLAVAYIREIADLQIAIITPYRAQCRLIQKKLKERCLDKETLEKITVGTVHAFQGSERDVVIWDVVEMRNYRIGRLYRGSDGDRLTNVAITRTKGKLVLICDPEAFVSAPGHESAWRIEGIIASRFRDTTISWSRLEKKLVEQI